MSLASNTAFCGIFTTFFAGFTFLATGFLTELFFVTGFFLPLPALSPFLGARVTAKIHHLF
jgi:hypothetical protein